MTYTSSSTDRYTFSDLTPEEVLDLSRALGDYVEKISTEQDRELGDSNQRDAAGVPRVGRATTVFIRNFYGPELARIQKLIYTIRTAKPDAIPPTQPTVSVQTLPGAPAPDAASVPEADTPA